MTLRGLALAALAMLALPSCQPDNARAEESCAVYRSFFAQVSARHVFSVHSQPDILRNRELAAPTRFVSGGVLRPPPPKGPLESFDIDTSAYFAQVASEPAMDISSCFESDGPRFIDPRSDADELVGSAESGILYEWALSPVAFAPDGQHALIAGSYHCGDPLCGGGVYYLFERSGAQWTLLGYKNLWVR